MQTRNKVFETNSSSSHSIVVDNGLDFVVPEISGDTISIFGGEFGWGYDELNTWEERASYAYTYAKEYGKSEDIEMLRSVIEEYTNKKVVFETRDGESYPFGYIDHQSVDEAETIFDSPENVKNVIFGKGSYIIIDNDNH